MTTPPPLLGADRLAFLYRIGRAFSSTLDLDRVLDIVMDEVLLAVHAERGFVVLREEDGQLVFRAARGLDQQTIDDPAFQVSRSVVERVMREGAPQWTSDAQNDDWLRARTSVVILGLRSILCVPLQAQGRSLGVIYVDNRLQAGLFSAEDLELLAAIATTAAAAVENARLYKVAVQAGRMERELQVAREVQTSFLPRHTPQIEGWEFAAVWQPAREVAGDFYDFISIRPAQGARAAAQTLGIVIADVSDKGMAAALFMVLSRSTVRASVAQGLPPREGIAQANRLICADADSGMFVSLFYGQLDPASGELTYVNAGHNPPLLLRGEICAAPDEGLCPLAEAFTELTRTGMVLGIEETAPYDEARVCLGSGDLLVLYTDGLTEMIDAQEQEFGLERLQRLILDHRGVPAAELASVLTQAVTTWAGSSPPGAASPHHSVALHDDVTVVVIKRS
jgi:sigma-B regulation protein RsbU (phosphoserine phosphatase)